MRSITKPKALPPQSLFTLLRVLRKRPRPSDVVPGESLQTEFVAERTDRRRLARYAELLGTDAANPPLTFHYLVAQRAQLETMLLDDFPFRIAGMVHVENALVEHCAPSHDAPLSLSTRVHIEERTSSGARLCTFETVAAQRQELVFSCTSKYLVERGAGRRPERALAEGDAGAIPAGQWTVAPSDGRRYASVSGDWNPIHLARWTARLMGMRSPIIHGMCLLAKATTLIEASAGGRVVKITGQFKSPVPLGARVELRLGPASGAYVICCDERIAVAGHYEPFTPAMDGAAANCD